MSKLSFLLFFAFFTLNSAPDQTSRWGQTGHRTTGLIAEQYLSPKAKEAVKKILGKDSIHEVSTWMDEVRSDRAYDYMTTWHYVTIPEGETYESSQKAETGDVIWALNKVIGELKAGDLTPEQRATDLKVLIHLVGDIHQPLHVGNGTDRGGNDIKVDWFWEPSNLHRVWDSDMIDAKQLSFTELSEFIDEPTQEQVKEWQAASVTEWAEESRTLLKKVYDLPENHKIGYRYAYDNWEIVELRLLQAGVRLAGVLNEIYK